MRHAEDAHSPASLPAETTLLQAGPAAVVPHVIDRLLRLDRSDLSWGEAVQGLCHLVARGGPDYARPCAPTLAYYLAMPAATDQLDKPQIVVALQQAGEYGMALVLPTLLREAADNPGGELADLARRIVPTLDPETKAPYRVILESLHLV